MKVGYVYNPIYLKHDTGNHVEVAKRLETIMSHLEGRRLKQRLIHIEPRPATTQDLALVHEERYIAQIREVAQRGGGWLDADTVMSADSYEAAVYAAGGAMEAVRAVMSGEVNSAFALVRPPGHHAEYNRAMGFCLFNNVAVAARYALAEYGLKRILIIDFDVHHGNGTQEAFYGEQRVLYISAHQYPFYPGTGDIKETGSGLGKGANVNIPMPAGCGDAEYQQVFEQIVVPAANRFAPEMILVSAGYDIHWSDPLAMMQVSVDGFTRMTKIIKSLADGLCNGRLAFTLEGGYALMAQAAAVEATFKVLLSETGISDPIGPSPGKYPVPEIASLVGQVKTMHGL